MIKNKHLARTIEIKRQNQQTTSVTAMAVNSTEQKDLLNGAFKSSSPKSMGPMLTDNHSPSANPSPHSVYNSSTTLSPSTAFYPSSYAHQRNVSPAYRPPSMPVDPGHGSPSFHESRPRVKTPVFEEFLTPPPSSLSYTPVNNPLLSVHSYMNVSFQDTTNSSTPMTSSSFSHHHHHHSAPYPF